MSKGQLQVLKMILRAGQDKDPGAAAAPIEELRASFDAFTTRFPPVEGLLTSAVGLTSSDGTSMAAEWVRMPDDRPPEGGQSERAILYLHGGGFVVGSLASHRQLAGRLSRAAGIPCLSLDYRLAPEHPFPAALDDTLAAYRWLAARFGSDRLAIAGDSAGAGLGLLAMTHLARRREPLPMAMLCMSPWVDYEGKADSLHRHAELDPVVSHEGLERMARLYVGTADMRHPEVSPLWADLRGLPPILIQAGGAETLLDDAERIADRARRSDVDVELEIWPDMIHAWHLFAGRLEEGQAALERGGRWLRDAWKDPA